MYKLLFNSFFLILALNAFCEDGPVFSIEDFSVYHMDCDEPFKLGMNTEEIMALFSNLSGFDNWEISVADGWETLQHETQGITFFEFDLDGTVFSFVFTDPAFRTSRGISVGDSIRDVSQKYELYTLNPPPNGTDVGRADGYIYIMQDFYIDEPHPNSSYAPGYKGGYWKTYAITFMFNGDDEITKIFVNVGEY